MTKKIFEDVIVLIWIKMECSLDDENLIRCGFGNYYLFI